MTIWKTRQYCFHSREGWGSMTAKKNFKIPSTTSDNTDLPSEAAVQSLINLVKKDDDENDSLAMLWLMHTS